MQVYKRKRGANLPLVPRSKGLRIAPNCRNEQHRKPHEGIIQLVYKHPIVYSSPKSNYIRKSEHTNIIHPLGRSKLLCF